MNETNAYKLFHTLNNLFISSPYGYRTSPITGKQEFHEGVDYSANGKSIPIYALEDGKVLYEGYDGSTGAIICYIHYPRLGYVGLYYHLANTYIDKGDKVTKDTKIGMMGTTGYSTGIHLHFDWFKYEDYSKKFYDRKYEDFNAYAFPLEYFGTPVNRDSNANQVEVIVNNLRCRSTPEIKEDNILGYINRGLYNVLNSVINGDYIWHEVEEGRWIADSDEWAIFYDKKIEEEPIIDTPPDTQNKPIGEQKNDDDKTPGEEQNNEEDKQNETTEGNVSILVKIFKIIINLLKEIFGGNK